MFKSFVSSIIACLCLTTPSVAQSPQEEYNICKMFPEICYPILPHISDRQIELDVCAAWPEACIGEFDPVRLAAEPIDFCQSLPSSCSLAIDQATPDESRVFELLIDDPWSR